MEPLPKPEPRFLRHWDGLVLLGAELYLRIRHRRVSSRVRWVLRQNGVRRVHLAHPRRVTEKYFWRKAVDHDPRFTVACDKIASRKIVEDLGVEVPMAPILWTGADPAQIPDHLVTGDVVIKAAHGWQQSIYPARDGLTAEQVRSTCSQFMASSHGQNQHQWGYFGVPPRIVIEERVFKGRPLTDVKVHTCGANPVWVTCVHPNPDHKSAGIWKCLADGSLTISPFLASEVKTSDDTAPPATTAAMIQIATKIGRAFDAIRVDFMSDGEAFYLGELTVYTNGGYVSFGHMDDPPGRRFWDIRRSWFLNSRQRGLWAIYAASLRRSANRQVRQSGEPVLPDRLEPSMLGLGS